MAVYNLDVFDHNVQNWLFFGTLPRWQQQPLHHIITEGLDRRRRPHEIANVLAQCYHETGRFRWTHEIGRGEGHSYGKTITLIRGKKEVYYGRGWIQTTWLSNYAKASVAATLAFGEPLDFVNNPDMIVQRMDVQAWYVWEGFISGMWTGKSLADFWTDVGTFDHHNARAIVNGDVATMGKRINDYANKFHNALAAAGIL